MGIKEDLLYVISKPRNKLIITTIYKHKEVHFSALLKFTKIPKVSLVRALDELMNYGIIKKKIEEPDKRISKVNYSLTDFGKKAVKLYDYAEQLEKELEEKTHSININVNVGDNTIIANNSNINIKK
jgi:DNA-binding HxlR family transcriptional regulator